MPIETLAPLMPEVPVATNRSDVLELRLMKLSGFIGSPAMNLLEARREGDCLIGEGFSLALSAPTEAQSVVLGMRPHDLRLDPEGGLQGRVELIEPMGWEAHVHVALGEGVRLLCRVESAALRGRELGSPVPGTVHFFADDPEGARLG